MELVTVARYDDPLLANIAKSKLNANGIRVILTNEWIANVDLLLSRMTGGIEVQVLRKDLLVARRLLNEEQQSN